jgi:hypothetical protein
MVVNARKDADGRVPLKRVDTGAEVGPVVMAV